MVVVLGPHAALSTNYGSRTGPLSIPHLMNPLHLRDPGGWVAGHLLNDNIGGSGTATKNLTPLTQTANKQHSGYEGRIKRFCDAARQYHEGHRGASFWYGLRYTVRVSPIAFGGFVPYSGAPSHITLRTELFKVDKTLRTMTPVHGIDRLKRLYEFGPVEIHNRDQHL